MPDLGVQVTRVGWRATFTDLGRRDAEISGVPSGGAADQHSAAVANILVNNPRDAVLIEAIGDIGLVADRPMLAAVTGAASPVTVNGAPATTWTPLVVPAGHELVVGGPQAGLRSYIALGGRLDAPRFMGSAAPDPRMGFPQQIERGDILRLAEPSALAGLRAMAASLSHFRVPALALDDDPWVLDVVPAAECDAMPEMCALLERSTYTVKPQSDHVGLRLDGPVHHFSGPEIVSHGVPIGAIEVPPADELIVLGRYRTLTAGYPVIGVVAQVDLPLLGQLTAGTSVRFRWTTRDDAVSRATQRSAALTALERSVTEAYRAVIERIGATWWL